MGELIFLPVRHRGTVGKKEIARTLRRSPRWIELQMKSGGLPFSRNAQGHARFDVEAVLAWRDGEERAS